jgi:hypothetical protein
MTGDAVQGHLAGQLGISGIVTSRQAAFESESHRVEIAVASYTETSVASTVDGAPGHIETRRSRKSPTPCTEGLPSL